MVPFRACCSGAFTLCGFSHGAHSYGGLSEISPGPSARRRKPNGLCLFLFIWIGVILTFFLFSTTQEYYTFPTFAAFALLLGKAMADLDARETSPKWGLIRPWGYGSPDALNRRGHDRARMVGQPLGTASTLSGTLTTHPEHYNLAFGHMHDLTPATFSHLAPLVYQTAALLIVGPSAAFLFALRKRWMVSFLLLAAMMIGLCHLYNAGMVAFEPVLGSKSLAKVVQYYYRPGDKIVINDFYEKGSTLNYYTGLQVYVMNGGFGVLWYGLQDKTAPKLCLTEDELLNEWTSGKRIFLFSENKPLESFLSRILILITGSWPKTAERKS